MKSLKEHFKARLRSSLSEDLGSPELMQNIIKREADENIDMSDRLDRVAKSPYLYVPDPNDPAKPMRVPEARLSRELQAALSSAAEAGSRRLSTQERDLIQDFIMQHGHFVGSLGGPDAYAATYQTDKGEFGRIFK